MLEPEAERIDKALFRPTESQIQHSIAISLKRIADIQEEFLRYKQENGRARKTD